MKNICTATLGNECKYMKELQKESKEEYTSSGKLCHTQNANHKCCKLCKCN